MKRACWHLIIERANEYSEWVKERMKNGSFDHRECHLAQVQRIKSKVRNHEPFRTADWQDNAD